MKKLFIFVIACAALTGLCLSAAHAQPRENICGNGYIGQGETCEPAMDPSQWPCNKSLPTLDPQSPLYSIACDPDTCTCLPRGCNDGVFEKTTEQCDFKSIERAALALYPTQSEWDSMTQEQQQELAQEIVKVAFTTMENQCRAGTEANRIQPQATRIICDQNCGCHWCGDGILAEWEECSTSSVPNVKDLFYEISGASVKSCDPNYECSDCYCSPIPKECNYNDTVDLPTEECDGTDDVMCTSAIPPGQVYVGCIGCKCHYRNVPTGILCGNGVLDTGEECEAGIPCPGEAICAINCQ